MAQSIEDSVQRQFATVLFADIVGYSRMMGDDEVGTLHTVRQCLEKLQAVCLKYSGVVVHVLGDGVVMMFSSPADAVRFALAVQNDMEGSNAGQSEDKQIWFRVGINSGQIFYDGKTASGEVVNIAARLENLARPGQVCITAAVYQELGGKEEFGFGYLGPQHLKNIRKSVEVFEVVRVHPAGVMSSAKRNIPAVPIGSTGAETASVVVLPLKFLGPNPDESWLADGLTEDITTSLSRFHQFFVIARNSASLYARGQIAPAVAARQLGVRYALSGSVRQAGTRIRAAVELLDVERSKVIWGEQYTRPQDDIFDIQDEITRLVVAATAVQIEASEFDRMRQMPPADIRAYEYVLQGQQHLYRYTREDNARARRLYESALRYAPRYARALAAKSRTLNIDWRYSWTDDEMHALDDALSLALSAIEIDPTDARGYGELGFAHLYRKEHDASISAYAKALQLNPNDADLMSDKADALAHAGRSEEAIALVEKAMRLNPFYPDQYLWHLGGAYYNLKLYDEAIRAIVSMQNPAEGHRILAASYAQLGRMDEARSEAAKVLAAHPDFQVERWAKVLPERLDEDLVHYVEGLRKAGL